MAELLCAAKDMGGYSKGDIILVFPNGWEYGASEGLPNFINITITDRTKDQIVNYMEGWRKAINYQITTNNEAGAYATLSAKIARADGLGALIKSDIEDILTRWGVVTHNEASNRLDIQIITETSSVSDGYLSVDSSQFTSTNTFVDGDCITVLDYSTTEIHPNLMIKYVDNRSPEIISNVNGQITYKTNTAQLLVEIKKEIDDSINERISKRRYQVASNQVDFVISRGGSFAGTISQLSVVAKDGA